MAPLRPHWDAAQAQVWRMWETVCGLVQPRATHGERPSGAHGLQALRPGRISGYTKKNMFFCQGWGAGKFFSGSGSLFFLSGSGSPALLFAGFKSFIVRQGSFIMLCNNFIITTINMLKKNWKNYILLYTSCGDQDFTGGSSSDYKEHTSSKHKYQGGIHWKNLPNVLLLFFYF